MKQWYHSIEPNWKDAVWWGVAIGMLFGRRFTGSVGAEWYTYYEAVYRGFQGMPEVANPPYTAVLLYPLTLFPAELGAEIFTLINVLAVALACQLTGGNRWAAMLSFPFGWLVWYGQIDGLVGLGAGLGYWAVHQKRPYWVGVACLLLGVKPQVGGILALYYLWYIKNIKAFFYPLLVMVVSILAFGFWPVAYLHRLTMSPESTFFTGQSSNIGLFPWGLMSWLVFLCGPYRLQQRIILILGATMLSSPYTAYYSTLSLIVFPLEGWIYIFFSMPLILPANLEAPVVTTGIVLLMTIPLSRRLWERFAHRSSP